MLRLLKVNHLAVIDHAELELEPGFICLTGESGAGKSVLIDALLLLRGGRASSDLVRTGAEKAVVEAEFELDSMDSRLELLESKQLFLRREVSKDGKSRAFVNGILVPNSVLQKYGDFAFEIYGQHGQQRLLKERHHLGFFEEHAGLAAHVKHFETLLVGFKDGFKSYWEQKDGEAQRLKEIDFLRLQIDEIVEVDPNEEDKELDLLLKKARNREQIRRNRGELAELLGARVLPDLRKMERLLGELSEYQKELEPYSKLAESAALDFQELHVEVDVWNDRGEDVPLHRLEERESSLNRLFMKYGKDVAEILAEKKRLVDRLQNLENASTGLDQAWGILKTRYEELQREREQLFKARRKAVKVFVASVRRELKDLAFGNADFQVDHQWPSWPSLLPHERDLQLRKPEFRFLFSSNPGEPVKPLSKVASGGELSRVLLALVNAYRRSYSRLLVFDEIDAGLGGQTSHAVGAKLADLGRSHQVLCVTHFAQVARFASQQIKLEKSVRKGRTSTSMVLCDYEQRIAELARLMGGDADAENLRDHARQLMGQSV